MSTSSTAFFCDEAFFWHDTGPAAVYFPAGGFVEPGEHVESSQSKRRLRNLVERTGMLDSLLTPPFKAATDEQILRFHSTEHLDRVKSVSETGGDTGEFAPIGPGGFEIAALSAGAAIAAVDVVMTGAAQNAYAMTRPPGHHAEPDLSRGFCVFGNIPIAVEHAIAVHGAKRVAVVDWDVHHGNGQQVGFYDRDDVLTMSIHQNLLFPTDLGQAEERGTGGGTGYNFNIPLPAGCGHETYLAAINDLVLPALDRFHPDLIMVACGYDASFTDPLGRMLCHSDTFREMTAKIMQAAEKHCEGKLILTHEGGYSAGYVPFCGLAVLEQLSGSRTECEDPFLMFGPGYPDQKMKPEHQVLLGDYAKRLDGIK
ncbi:class II histone deacetylase [Leisingera caerulea]|uniref:class II histone deacetylase n=1 Tax=Leisingera caerulea TaxID=506591 RepID=UPI0004234E48|nr:class II histone deacetylase [Leisingera caerulea]